MVGDTLVVGSPEALDACLMDGVAAAFVFVVGGDVADALVEPDAVVPTMMNTPPCTTASRMSPSGGTNE
jgi:hypothetical protein